MELKTPQAYYQSIVLTGRDQDASVWGGLTLEQLQASPLVALSHVTFPEGLESILRMGKLQHRLALSREGIPVFGGLAGAYPEEAMIEKSAYNQGQFPGVYMYLKPQADFLSSKFYTAGGASKYDTPIELLFSLAPLQQQNYHLNMQDEYGLINNVTFSPKTLAANIYRLPGVYGNYNCGAGVCHPEVIFHDSLPLALLRAVLVWTPEQKRLVEELLNYQVPVYLRSAQLGAALAQTQFVDGQQHLVKKQT